MQLKAAARFDFRNRRAARNGDNPRPPPTVSAQDFAWLEGATGVELCVRVCGGLHTVSVAGDIDHASIDVVESAIAQTIRRSPRRVELDFRRVAYLGSTGQEMIARARALAEAERVPFHVTLPALAGLQRPGLLPRSGLLRLPFPRRRAVRDRNV
jgi:hypothetical protein